MGDIAAMIALDALVTGYGKHPGKTGRLSGVFHSGTMTAVIGANGAGKSTLLKTLAGLLPPLSGQIVFDAGGRMNPGYLPQISEFDRHFPLCAEDLVLMGFMRSRGMLREISRRQRYQAQAIMESVGMLPFRRTVIGALSGGQLQRLLFARLLLEQSSVVLLDEPFTGVDAPTVSVLLNIMTELQRNGVTLICVLHDLACVQSRFSDVLWLREGGFLWGKAESVLSCLQMEGVRGGSVQ